MWKRPLHPPCFHYSQIHPSLALMKSSSDSRNGTKNRREKKERQTFFHPSTHSLTNSMSEQQGLVSALARLSPCDLWPLTTVTLPLSCRSVPKSTLLLFERGNISMDSPAWLLLMESCRKLTYTCVESKKTKAQYFVHSSLIRWHMERNVDTDEKTLIKLYLPQPLMKTLRAVITLYIPVGRLFSWHECRV